MTSAVALRAEALPLLHDRLPTPAYDRAQVRTGIVHIGVGGFHRAHQAMYLDRLMNAGQAMDWGVCGVGVMSSDRRMQAVMDAQDGLYTLVVKHADGTYEPRIIGAITEYLFAPDDPEAVIEKMAAAATRIVSLTVTEGGYNLRDGEFDPQTPDVAHDLRAAVPSRTSFGLVVEALARRRERDLAPFAVMSCDNLEGNGDLARRAFGGFAALRDRELGEWVTQEVSFPNSMVDRITPVTSDADRAAVRERFGVEDRWPVVCEPFEQWVLQDDFPLGRPPLEDVGVQLVADVEPYELIKLRLLNASHQAMGYLARLCGYEYVHEAARDRAFRAFLLGYMDVEATPTLKPVPGIDLDDYKHTVVERFANPEVRDTLERICTDTSDRIPHMLLPVVHSQLATGGEIDRCATVVASWARYAEGADDRGEPMEVRDRLRDELVGRARRYDEEPDAFLAYREVFGSLSENSRFLAAYRSALASLHERGARATLEALVERLDASRSA